MAYTQQFPQIQKLLTGRFETNPVWKTLFTSVNKVMYDRIVKMRWNLERIRDPRIVHRGDWTDTPDGDRGLILGITQDESGAEYLHLEIPDKGTTKVQVPGTGTIRHDRKTLISQARRHGFDYFSDTLSEEDYERINRFIELYWPEAGNENFIRFIGFIKRMYLELEELWTAEYTGDTLEPDDYPWLEPRDPIQSKSVSEGGDVWQTSHVQIVYDVLQTPEPNLTDLVPLFYLLAPIHLVLERIIAAVWGEVPYYHLHAGMAMTYEGSIRKWANDGQVDLYSTTKGSNFVYEGSVSDNDSADLTLLRNTTEV